LVSWALDHSVGAGLDATVAVTGAVDLADIAPPDVVLLANPAWAEGMATSLAVAVGWARRHGFDAMVVGLGDQPLVGPEAWREVASAPGALAVATYGGRRHNPVKLARPVWDELPSTGDEGARAVMRRRPELVHEVPCDGDPLDVDTPEDLNLVRQVLGSGGAGGVRPRPPWRRFAR
jgi:CTP:molybdopterin cytidylyltransferase MocA